MRSIGVGSLIIPEEDKVEIRKILDSNQVSPGPYVRRFEQQFAAYHGAEHGLFVNSGTDALRLALAALKEVHHLSDGDYVVVPAITFVATLNVILQNNLRPLLIDVDPFDFNLDRILLRGVPRLGLPVQVIFPVHMFGQPCQMRSIMDLAKECHYKVIEDSCETMGVSKIEGDIACFSTYVAHLIATGIGGLAITNNPEYAEIMRSLANHGRDPYYIPGFRKPELTKELLKKRFKFDRIGYSSRMTEFEAALGLGQLSRLHRHLQKRREVACSLTYGLEKWADLVQLPWVVDQGPHAFMMYPILVREGTGIDKWDLCLHLEKHGIETREMLPLINQPCYKHLGINPNDLPIASRINRTGFYIGCHPGMTADDIQHVTSVFDAFFSSAGYDKRQETRVA